MSKNITYYINVESTAVTINNSGLYAYFPVSAYHIEIDDNPCYFNRSGKRYNDFFIWEEVNNKKNILYDGKHIAIYPENDTEEESWELEFINSGASVNVEVYYQKNHIPYYYGVKSNLEGGNVFFNGKNVNSTIKNGVSIFSVMNNGEIGEITISGTNRNINELETNVDVLEFSNESGETKSVLITAYAENYEDTDSVESYNGVTSTNVTKYALLNSSINRDCVIKITKPNWIDYELEGNLYNFTTLSDNTKNKPKEGEIIFTLNDKTTKIVNVKQYGIERLIDNLSLMFGLNDYYIDCGNNLFSIDDLLLSATTTYVDVVNGVKTNYITEITQVTSDNYKEYIQEIEVIRKNGENSYIEYNDGIFHVNTLCNEEKNPTYSLIVHPLNFSNDTQILNIEQETSLFNVYLNNEPYSDNFEFDETGGTLFVKVETYNDVSFSVEENNYYTFNSENNTIAIYCGLNENNESHETELLITNECTKESKKIKLSQKSFNDDYCVLLHTPFDDNNMCQNNDYVLTIDGNEQDVELIATLFKNNDKVTDLYFDSENRNPKYIINKDDITINGDVNSGLSDTKLVLHFSENFDKNKGVRVTVKYNEIISNRMLILQTSFNYIFKVNESDEFIVDVDYRFINEQIVQIVSMLGNKNIGYTIENDSQWINAYIDKDTNYLFFTYEENKEPISREAKLTLIQDDSKNIISVIIRQKGNTYILGDKKYF